jgi:hypothetical protein
MHTYCLLFWFSGSKNNKGVINDMKEYDEEFMIFIFRGLSSSEIFAVNTLRERTVDNVDVQEFYSLEGMKDCAILNTTYQEFREGYAISKVTMDAILQMFRSREADIASNYECAFVNRKDYSPRKRCYFLSGKLLEILLNCDDVSIEDLRPWIGVGDFSCSEVSRIFIPLPYSSSSFSRWVLAVVDLQSEIFYVIDFMAADVAEKSMILNSVNPFSNALKRILGVNWQLKWYPNICFPLCSNVLDTGIYAIAALYFAVHQCPIFFEEQHVKGFREKFLHFLINKYLPM